MSFLDRIFNRNQPEGDHDPEPSITLTGDRELATIEETATRSVVVATGERAAAFADALIPAAANAAQAAQTYGMAVVKFPEGVGWANLCVRKSDGWNLLSNMKGGKFNEMAAIKQAGLQPAAVANLALQGAAVLVGQAYMTQINDKLEGISKGVAEIQRAMERSRECRLKARFDALERVALMFDESGVNSDKRTVALQAIEDATVEAQDACHYEADAMRGDRIEGRQGKDIPVRRRARDREPAKVGGARRDGIPASRRRARDRHAPRVRLHGRAHREGALYGREGVKGADERPERRARAGREAHIHPQGSTVDARRPRRGE